VWYYRHSLKSYSYSFRGPFLNIALSQRINGFLKRLYWCFTENVFEVKVHQLLNSAMHDLSTKMQSPDHINLYPLLPPYRDHCITLRPREHDYELPICTYNITSPPAGVRSIAITVSVCLSLGLPIGPHVSKTTHPNFTKFLANVNSRSRWLYADTRPSVVCLIVCLSVTLVHPTQAVVIFRNMSTALGTSVDIHWKFHGDRPRGTPPPGELNTWGVAKGPYIFSCCGLFFLLSFFPRLISAVGDWMFTILWHMVWP